ncbi:hypothetical protein J3A78_002427 [Streptomyces sp. PvR006]|uniref:DUF6233 domain-containing protein n=1 Tax=Streptomyces sp. PvR006 TaxID=2817860 RepID=UPI001AE7AD46|nr:DUF6233 domain-containing protein [Streptomyces sp. PvR006]MBP2581949.1 hypothetical protein [Streptomyces sp. PvR006]
MSDEPTSPELEKLRFLYRVQCSQLAQTERWIDAELAKVRERAARRPLPDGPAFVLSYLRVGGKATADSVHLGDCRMVSHHTKPLDEAQARQAITSGGLRACEICRPDSELGVLE